MKRYYKEVSLIFFELIEDMIGFSIEEWKECQRNQLNGHLETMYKFQQLLQKNEGKGKGSGLGSSGKGNVKNMMDTGLLLVLVRILSTTQKTASK